MAASRASVHRAATLSGLAPVRPPDSRWQCSRSPAAARAADPIMPLSEVRAGMTCTGLSVVRGTAISSFDVEVLDVIADDPAVGGARLLVRVSGPGRRRHRRRPGLLGLADPLRRAQRRRDLGGHRRVRQQGRAGHADRGDPRRAGRARAARRQARARRCCAPRDRWPGRSRCPACRRARAACSRAAAARVDRTVLAAPPGPLGGYPVAGARARGGGGGVAVDRRHLDRRRRHRRLPRRRPGLRLRPRARRRSAAARCSCRTPTSSG